VPAESGGLTAARKGRYRMSMAYTYIAFDFGTDEDAAQKARQRVERWTQSFRLGKKILLKFERTDGAAASDEKDSAASGKAKKEKSGEASEKISVLIRLDFSDHEKLSYQRWLDRIPKEEVFKPAKGKVVRAGESDFAKTETLFESLD
jgi:inactivated superfamily I helicase